MLEALKQEVFEANLELPRHGLIKYTWGNVSAIDRKEKLFVIKPSGVSYEAMKADDMVVCDLDRKVVEGKLNPSSDTPTHAVLYKHFAEIGGIVHTHSTWATIWAQAGLDVPAMGTTHADTFYGSVPCTRYLTQEEIDRGYEESTGDIIIQTFNERKLDPLAVPGVLLHGHGPFTWGKDAKSAVMNAVVLNEVCKMNLFTRSLNSFAEELPQRILDKHYLRKHGKDAYYGQK
ncbi:L-ribulose-5-phosphate 4-epimerase [Melissococcus plutonius]|uniref:L-ribulose-5-phosphate 4-epimerase n=1 Tax=Melissococcus plutonius (strain ATCC 35311 / DSM 29964 / CIP 104052 / LMG 20360 / NCIMB 702443) TaxID=940190 RepID=F3YAW9_MELPT|nr:L-ribulose-5-phosphate 4-epimerase [Melissococcus plutonius]KMT32437.1 L-ribulose-5-phosphate 4-epimerase AraD [Melissococcus plutonius]KMT33956.1 L-ribulose-5-phosphate 4-epimerase AraD [Melissococcus plutonius]KMT39943.1 L-ribulose-5-phosphate 4-epimerase AraD [Melissococcus plutonius]MBB5178454.1 L-ribulose-5-phosphate 4-epimerase [Melissococcus plutonius]BAK21647.1 L-ribulose-5-phosphate 4-epimerase [Melissococcus plutonius ATCC 35311]